MTNAKYNPKLTADLDGKARPKIIQSWGRPKREIVLHRMRGKSLDEDLSLKSE